MELFFEDLSKRIVTAVKKDMERIIKEVGEEKIYSVALVTDSDCITLYLALNTYEYMKKRDEQYVKILKGKIAEEKIASVKNGTSSFTKWIPDEWGYSDGNNSELNKISKLLYEKEEKNSGEYEKNIDLFFEAVTTAFKQLIEEKTFGKDCEEITYFISMSDDERTSDIEDYSAKLLNSENVCKTFLKRMEP